MAGFVCLLGFMPNPQRPHPLSGMFVETFRVIFRLLLQTTKNPEVRTVTRVCGFFTTLPKNCGPFLKFWDFCTMATEPRYFMISIETKAHNRGSGEPGDPGNPAITGAKILITAPTGEQKFTNWQLAKHPSYCQ